VGNVVIGSGITFGSGITVGTVIVPVVKYIVEENGSTFIITENGNFIVEEN
jgi:hypothetical protein